MALSKCPLEGWIFGAQRAKNKTPRVTPKLNVREVSQSGFWNISSQPTSEPSFSQIGWPQLLAPGTLSQTMTLKLINLQRKKILYDARKRRLHSKSAKVLRVIRERERDHWYRPEKKCCNASLRYTGRNSKILWGNAVNNAALLAFLEVIGEPRQGIIAKTYWDKLRMTLGLFKGFH